MRRPDVHDLVFLAGLLAVLVGLYAIAWPLALVALGAVCMGAASVGARQKGLRK